jgi:pimeloyl-ACP methyl ester carboxylesterase
MKMTLSTCSLLLAVSCLAQAQIHVDKARIGCLDIQLDGNLTGLVAASCNNKGTCSFKAPTPDQYQRAGVQAKTRSFCTQAMEIDFHCGTGAVQKITVPGDAWNNPPAQLACAAPPSPTPPPAGVAEPIQVTKARIGCLDIQTDGNLTGMAAAACNGKEQCMFKAPTPDQYQRAGVQAKTRSLCTQGMEITYRCGSNDPQIAKVNGDAWNNPPAALICGGATTVAQNAQYVEPPTEPCTPPDPKSYQLAPSDMLDWTKNTSKGDYTTIGFHPPDSVDPAQYNSASAPVPGAPGSTIGSNEGRLRGEIRSAAVTARTNPAAVLCEAAKMFTRNHPAAAGTPSDQAFGNAFADLTVTGKASFAEFTKLHPTEATLQANSACSGASPASITTALDRAYAVAKALRGPHTAPERVALGWVAVSGEDDQPYRPVNVPTNSGKFQEFQIKVNVPVFNIPVNTRYMIAHARNTPAMVRPAAPLVDGGTPARRVAADPLPALAPDADVILFVHGMDSRLEEADDLTAALHKLGGRNWTVVSMDLATSGYGDNIDHRRVSPITEVACHVTKLVDFNEEYVVAFVDALDAALHGQLKPRIRAVVGGSLGGNMALRLGRRPNTPWVTNVVPWSPASIWPSLIAQRNAVMAGCDTGWDNFKDRAVNQSLKWAGLEDRFLPDHETPELRRELFYGGFDWNEGDFVAIFSPDNHQPQASCWFANSWSCKAATILSARLDRHETYDANYRAWHWRLGGEQLAFSHQQNAAGTSTPLYLLNTKRTLLLTGTEDVCGSLGADAIDVAGKMTRTPGRARFLRGTGHSLDNEHPDWVARQIADFLK